MTNKKIIPEGSIIMNKMTSRIIMEWEDRIKNEE